MQRRCGETCRWNVKYFCGSSHKGVETSVKPAEVENKQLCFGNEFMIKEEFINETD